MRNLRSTIRHIQEEQQSYIGREFIAPLIPGSQVMLYIGRMVHHVRVMERGRCIGIFQLRSLQDAEFIREAGVFEAMEYLKLFRSVQVMIIDPDQWLGAVYGTRDFHVVKIAISPHMERFDVIRAYVVGNILISTGYRHTDPIIAAHMRVSLALDKPLERLPGLNVFHHMIYEKVRAAKEKTTADKVKDAVTFMGGTLLDFSEVNETIRVQFQVGGRRFTSSVALAQNDFQVLSAGVCLSGDDNLFDLTTLVGVLKRGVQDGDL